MRRRILLGVLAVVAGVALVTVIPRERQIRVIFAGADLVVVDGDSLRLPYWLELEPDEPAHLWLVNHTGDWRAAGTVAVPPNDSTHADMDQCIPRGGPVGLVPLR